MNKPIHRRKWSFEKGRNSGGIIIPAVITLLVVTAIATGFRYVRKPSDNQQQTTRVLLVAQREKILLEDLDYFDPANTFGINNGGQPFCLICRRSHHLKDCPGKYLSCDLEKQENTPIPVFKDDALPTVPAAKMVPLPVSGILAAILPTPPEKSKMLHSHLIVGKDGKLFSLQKLDQLKAANIRAATTLQISGEGLLARVQIINSCGNRELDMAAGKILKSAGTAPGVYTINWNRNGGGR